jgi:hypothetical protein
MGILRRASLEGRSSEGVDFDRWTCAELGLCRGSSGLMADWAAVSAEVDTDTPGVDVEPIANSAAAAALVEILVNDIFV